jgi:hypothetical protein
MLVSKVWIEIIVCLQPSTIPHPTFRYVTTTILPTTYNRRRTRSFLGVSWLIKMSKCVRLMIISMSCKSRKCLTDWLTDELFWTFLDKAGHSSSESPMNFNRYH